MSKHIQTDSNTKELIFNKLFGYRCIKCNKELSTTLERSQLKLVNYSTIPCYSCWKTHCLFCNIQNSKFMSSWECVRKGKCLK